MNMQEWERKIKSAKFHVEHAKTNFNKQVAEFDLRTLNSEFTKERSEWAEQRKAETKRLFKARMEQTKQINEALDSLEDELTQAKIFTIINPSASPTKPA
jgi:hypothetical protein